MDSKEVILWQSAGGKLPDNWSIQSLGSLLRTSTSLTVGVMYPGSHTDSGVPLVRVADVKNGKVADQPEFRIGISVNQEYSKTQLDGTELLITLVGNPGDCVIVEDYMKGWNVARALAVARFSNPEIRFFVRYVLLSKPSKHLIDTRLNTTVQKTLNLKDIKELPIPMPPPSELSNIVGTLSALDDKIDLNHRMNETLEQTARALFKDWFVDFGPTKAKMAGQAAYLEGDLWELFPERLDEAGVPEGWESQPLSSFFSIIGGGTPKTSMSDYWGGKIPWFSVVDTPPNGSIFVFNTDKSITELGLSESAARLVPAGTTIISARGTVGNLAVTAQPMTFNQSCYALRGQESVGDHFVYFAAQQMVTRLQGMAHGSVFSTITRQTFEAISMPKPNAPVLSAFERVVAGLLDRVRANVAESHTLANTRDLLLPKLMSGEIRVDEAEKAVGDAI